MNFTIILRKLFKDHPRLGQLGLDDRYTLYVILSSNLISQFPEIKVRNLSVLHTGPPAWPLCPPEGECDPVTPDLALTASSPRCPGRVA